MSSAAYTFTKFSTLQYGNDYLFSWAQLSLDKQGAKKFHHRQDRVFRNYNKLSPFTSRKCYERYKKTFQLQIKSRNNEMKVVLTISPASSLTPFLRRSRLPREVREKAKLAGPQFPGSPLSSEGQDCWMGFRLPIGFSSLFTWEAVALCFLSRSTELNVCLRRKPPRWRAFSAPCDEGLCSVLFFFLRNPVISRALIIEWENMAYKGWWLQNGLSWIRYVSISKGGIKLLYPWLQFLKGKESDEGCSIVLYSSRHTKIYSKWH